MTVPSPHEVVRRAQPEVASAEPTSDAAVPWSPEAWFAHVPAVAYVRRFDPDDLPRSHFTFIDAKIGSLLGHPRAALVEDTDLWTSLIHPDDLVWLAAFGIAAIVWSFARLFVPGEQPIGPRALEDRSEGSP